jgi:hypothetical protein
LAPELPDRGAAIAPRVAAIVGRELGWGESRQALEVESYLAAAVREYSVSGPEHDGDGASEAPPTDGVVPPD